jgi:hypothetical protein
MTKLIVTSPKPRNPLVAAAHRRHAGPHGNEGDARREGRQALRRELAALDLPRSRPPGL